MSIALILAAAVAATHSVQVDHAGAPVEAHYAARTEIETRTIGAHTPNRVDGRRCRWTATIIVERRLGQASAPARALSADKMVSGSEAGACTPETETIARRVAARADTVRAHLLAVVERDRAPLLTELDAVKTMATN